MLAGQWGRLLRLLARDLALGALAMLAWRAALGAPPGAAAVALAILAAAMAALGGYLLHEWGHLAGAIAARARVELPRSAFESPFLFRFDRAANSRQQFFAMALGGFAGSLATVAAYLAFLPRDTLATAIALALTGLGVLATLAIEVPEFWRVWRGGPIPDGAAFVSSPPR